jgi:hypothetical protein
MAKNKSMKKRLSKIRNKKVGGKSRKQKKGGQRRKLQKGGAYCNYDTYMQQVHKDEYDEMKDDKGEFKGAGAEMRWNDRMNEYNKQYDNATCITAASASNVAAFRA